MCYSYFRNAKSKSDGQRCLGTKTSYQNENGESVFEYKWKSFDEVIEETQCLAHAIINMHLFNEVIDDSFGLKLNVLGISSVNREEWIMTDLAANLLGITTVPLYETLGSASLELILEQAGLTTIFGTDKSLLNIILQGQKIEDVQKIESERPASLYHLSKIVVFDEASPKLQVVCHKYNIQIYHYLSLLMPVRYARAQEQIIDFDHTKTSFDQIFTISYTSGTEKNSKGVLITNLNFISAVENILKVAGEMQFTAEDTYISYLPLAHVFDRLGVYAALSVGAAVGFFGGEILKIIDDLQLLKPTIFPSVPRLLNKVYDRIHQSLQQANPMKKWLFYRGLRTKQYYLEHQGLVNYNMYDRIVFNKAKERLGGRVRVMITASAPIADNILAFLKCVFCCPIIEAYGQTESCGASFSTKVFDNKTGHVGGPALGIEFKFKDCEELGYTQDSIPYPKGEVCLRGPSIFLGYFKNKELTDSCKDNEGWLSTGDVGMLLPGNAVKIIDRIKNIFKLAQGEYIIAEKLERIYEQSQYVAQLFIYGDSLQSHIVSVIYPEYIPIKTFCEAHNLPTQSLSNMILHKEVQELIQKDLQSLAIENKLNSLEQVRNHFRLIDQEFEIGVSLTPTMKIRRHQAKEVYKALIQDMYSSEDNNTKV